MRREPKLWNQGDKIGEKLGGRETKQWNRTNIIPLSSLRRFQNLLKNRS